MAANYEKVNGDAYQRLQSSFGKSSSSFPKQQQQQLPFLINQLEVPQLNMSQFNGQVPQLPPNLGFENTSRRVGIPPSHPQIPSISPYSRIPFNHPGNQQMGQQNFSTSPGPSHNRSLSQPSFFALDFLPTQSPSPSKDSSSNYMSGQASADVSMEEKDGNSHSFFPPPFTKGTSLRVGESPPPHKLAHRRSNSDIPFGFSSVMESSLPLIPLRSLGALVGSVSNRDNSVAQPAQLVSTWEKGGESNGEGMGKEKTEREVVDELFSTYLNLDNIDVFNSSGTDEKLGTENPEDFDSRASGSKTNGCDNTDNEATGSVNEIGSSVRRPGVSLSGERREGVKRNATDDIAPTSRHYRSVSMDSFMGKMNFADESLSTLPSSGATTGQLSPVNSSDANSDAFSLDFGNGEFNGSELNKIVTNEKLAEIAMSDPKRAKRILANRQSAARSKERKMRYIAELEHKVQTLQTEATTLSAEVTMLQRDFAGLTNHNNELKYRLHAMERQAQLQDALNETLVAEVQRLKLASAEFSGNASKFQQLSVNHQSFQQTRLNMHELQQQSNSNTAVKH